MDETGKQLLEAPRPSLPAEPGQAARVDDEDERGGVANPFCCCEPLAGRRWASVIDQRTQVDRAHRIQGLVDLRSPDAEREAEVAAWQARRNATASAVVKRRSTADARIKLKRLYPAVQE